MSKELYLAATFDGYGSLSGGIFIDDYGDVYVANFYDANVSEGVSENVSDGDTIDHTLGITPTVAFADGVVPGEDIKVTAVGSTTLTIAIKKPDPDNPGGVIPGTTQKIYWRVKYIP
jgi:hypothetical protein